MGAPLSLELPSGTYIDLENAEALAVAIKNMREGKPIVIRREDGGTESCGRPKMSRSRIERGRERSW